MNHESIKPLNIHLQNNNRDEFSARPVKSCSLDRREWLGLGMGAALGVITGENLLAQQGKIRRRIRQRLSTTQGSTSGYIDAHVHVWTPDTKKYPLAPGFKKEEMKPESFTPDELLSHANPVGVDRIVLIQMSYYNYDNTYMLEAIRDYPGVFSGVAIIDETSPDACKTMRKLKGQGVRGFRLYPNKRPAEKWLSTPGIHAMWKCGAEEGLAMCLLINPPDLPLADKMCEQFPDTRVVIDHFARIGVDGEIREQDLGRLCDLAKHKNTYVKVSAFYALGKKKAPYDDLIPMIRRLLDAYGPERLMWATDCPYQVQEGHNYADSLALIRERIDFLSPEDRDHLLRKTAERVYFS